MELYLLAIVLGASWYMAEGFCCGKITCGPSGTYYCPNCAPSDAFSCCGNNAACNIFCCNCDGSTCVPSCQWHCEQSPPYSCQCWNADDVESVFSTWDDFDSVSDASDNANEFCEEKAIIETLNTFNGLDVTGDGQISLDEAKYHFALKFADDNETLINETRIIDGFAKMDTDGDGYVSAVEFDSDLGAVDLVCLDEADSADNPMQKGAFMSILLVFVFCFVL